MCPTTRRVVPALTLLVGVSTTPADPCPCAQLTGLDPLPSLPCLGFLNLSATGVTLAQLVSLRPMYIMELAVSDNPQLHTAELTAVEDRLVLVHLLPRVWVINGVFVSLRERAAATELFSNTSNASLASVRCAAAVTARACAVAVRVCPRLRQRLRLVQGFAECGASDTAVESPVEHQRAPAAIAGGVSGLGLGSRPFVHPTAGPLVCRPSPCIRTAPTAWSPSSFGTTRPCTPAPHG